MVWSDQSVSSHYPFPLILAIIILISIPITTTSCNLGARAYGNGMWIPLGQDGSVHRSRYVLQSSQPRLLLDREPLSVGLRKRASGMLWPLIHLCGYQHPLRIETKHLTVKKSIFWVYISEKQEGPRQECSTQFKLDHILQSLDIRENILISENNMSM